MAAYVAGSAHPTIGDWTLRTSTRTGQRYWHNGKTAASFWYDATLPPGWAWGMASPTSPRFYVNLHTGAQVDARPSAPAAAFEAPVPASTAGVKRRGAAAEESSSEQAPPDAKRPRAAAAALCEAAATAQAAAPAAELAGPPAVLPRMLPDECLVSKPDVRPSALIPARVDSSFFGEPHRIVLSQLLRAVEEAFASLASWEAVHRDAGASEEREAVMWDIGAGEGAATAFMLSATPFAAARGEVYAVDVWRAPYYAATLREFGHARAASAYESRYLAEGPPVDGAVGGSGAATAAAGAIDTAAAELTDPYTQFCVNFWDNPRVTPLRFPDLAGVEQLRASGIEPALVYVDCELHGAAAKAVLREVTRRFPKALVAGGGWELSASLRAAVVEVSREQGLTLHVEQGRAWTFAAQHIKATGNAAGGGGGGVDGPMATAAEAEAALALRVESAAVAREERVQRWLGEVLAVVAACDDPAALRMAVGAHGRARRQRAELAAGGGGGEVVSEGAGEAEAAAAAEGSDDEAAAWIDAGDTTKRHLTPLMHAAKQGRTRLVCALVDEHGARVNRQAERSLFTPLSLAAYEGHEAAVRELLARGADPLLMNRFGETALANAQTQQRAGVVALLRPLTEAAAAQVRSATPASPPARYTLRNGRAVTVRRVARGDTVAVQTLYTLCQAEFATDAVSRRVRERWTAFLFATDLADPEARYSTIPRAALWLCTMAEPDFDAASSLRAAPALLDGERRVVVGCVALRPLWDPRTATTLSVGAAAAAAAGAAAPPDGAAAAAAYRTPALDTRTAELLRMCVHPGLRRCGAAATLLRHAEDWARLARYAAIRLTTQPVMAAAMRLYARVGYVNVSPPGGVEKSYHGDRLVTVDFEKRLEDGAGSGTNAGAAVAHAPAVAAAVAPS